MDCLLQWPLALILLPKVKNCDTQTSQLCQRSSTQANRPATISTSETNSRIERGDRPRVRHSRQGQRDLSRKKRLQGSRREKWMTHQKRNGYHSNADECKNAEAPRYADIIYIVVVSRTGCLAQARAGYRRNLGVRRHLRRSGGITNGSAAPSILRRNVFAAIADARYSVNVSTCTMNNQPRIPTRSIEHLPNNSSSLGKWQKSQAQAAPAPPGLETSGSPSGLSKQIQTCPRREGCCQTSSAAV